MRAQTQMRERCVTTLPRDTEPLGGPMLSQPTCSMDGCEMRPHGHGLCVSHYSRWRKNGDPSVVRRLMPRPNEDAATRRQRHLMRFWQRVDKSGDCWLWMGARDRDGYGQFSIGPKQSKAHRFAYEIEYGPLPAGRLVCHTCDNPPCVRYHHLFLGTNEDNLKDMARKGRSTRGRPRGW